MGRWDLEFRAKDEALPPQDEHCWIIPRKFTVEIAHLRPNTQ
ncbi:MAG: hypothetical protein ACK42E_02750 [Candidatus Bipolaricaulaceae bacterium]